MKFKIVAAGSLLTLVLIGMLTWAFSTESLSATIDITPDTLNLKSKGNWITCRIELPESYKASDIDRTTIMLNGSIPVDPFWVNGPQDFVIPLLLVFAGSRARNDGVSHLMVKFNRTVVGEFIVAQGITYGNVTLTITGEIDGELFEGSDIIRGRMPGDVDSNGAVDIVDVATVAVAFGSTDPYTDLTEDGSTDVCDVATVAMNFGKAY
ncbi:MAG: hypothetical protein OEX77_09455 [Candidatus Bathyarchaeota archaeon]|nr:hypothetical protein [Candidatus Bathyarchaeota archaeon]MDH5734068.1 hypothetical protein [Candidatus Bathyarchaeota archaeon]